jgi:hypothetical protein
MNNIRSFTLPSERVDLSEALALLSIFIVAGHQERWMG